ncbi:MAG: type II toxin-antitoxin system VapC family toxin [Endozoicomonas sp.]|uniref:type II toxin-antitoxin system VapC family toxin n=1 Tax=Endozoicomonas sp. TaxID=1892382 RepID=UPI003D9B4ED7
MEGIDTNVLVRYLVKDDLKQYEQSIQLLTNSKHIFLSPVVLVETVWVLTHFYQVEREHQHEMLRAVISLQRFVTQDRQAVLRALDDYSKGFDFADAMIGHHNGLQCQTTWTFDRKASRLDAFSLMNKA